MPELFAGLEALIEAAPELPDADALTCDPSTIPFLADTLAERTGVPARYRAGWPRPDDAEWHAYFAKVAACVKAGGIIGLIGNRGTGKTRLAAEVMRDVARIQGRYATAMGLFLRIRSTFGKKGGESESDIVREFSKAPLLILDEIQERGGTEWEDRLLTHILDARYGDMRPTILIANLDRAALALQLGDSINSRLIETGGVLEMTGPSHRLKP
jgi:DNA replication protein DnaC